MVSLSELSPDIYVNHDTDELNYKNESLEDLDGMDAADSIYDLNSDDFLFIDVCGMKYVTLKKTLERFPKTLLGNKNRRRPYFVKLRNAYFFDRNRQCFESILYYYQSGGLLVRPSNVPMEIFVEEVSFFDLGDSEIYKLRITEGYVSSSSLNEKNLPKNIWQRRIWMLMEYPDSSYPARILATFSVLVIAVSIVVFCTETMPGFGEKEVVKTGNKTYIKTHKHPSKFAQPWFSLEVTCISWFTLEYVIRFLTSPSKKDFLKSFLNIIDLLAILPYLISMSVSTGVLRIFRLVRIFRIFKLSRHSIGLQILGRTLRASLSELGMLIFFLILGVILFSSAMFYAESGKNDMFESIPDTFWYSIVTMTTVGYGDKAPITWPGKIVGSLCAISGVLTIALPVPVIVSNFEFFCKRDRYIARYTRTSRKQSDINGPLE